MRIARTILALVIAVAVATLPMVGGFAAAASAAGVTSMSDCGHHDLQHKSHHKNSVGDCPSMAACAVNCFVFVTPVAASLPLPLLAATIEPELASPVLLAHTDGRVFRPPRA